MDNDNGDKVKDVDESTFKIVLAIAAFALLVFFTILVLMCYGLISFS